MSVKIKFWIIKLGTRPQICEKKAFSGEETPIFGLYMVNNPMYGAYKVTIMSSVFARQ